MWTSAGKVNFDVDGSGHLLDKKIKWYYDNNSSPVFQIGEVNDDKTDFRFDSNGLTIGVLEDYQKQVSNRIDSVDTRLDGIDDTIEGINGTLNDVDVSLGNIDKTITDLGTELKEQIDGKCNTWYQSADPAINWQNTDSSNTLSYVHEHLGDMWFDTDDNKSYVFSEGDLKDGWKSGLDYKSIDSTATGISGSHKYYWRVAAIPQELYDTFDGKANIFIDNPSGQVYHIGDIWIVEKDYASNITFADSDTTGKVKKGVILIATSSADTQSFSYSHWSKKDRYTDDTTALAAKNQLNLWASDKVISPVERTAINDIGKQILAEYPALTGQAKEYGLNVVECLAYTAYTATTANATATTNFYGATATPNSGDSIIISSSTHTDASTKVTAGVQEDYSNIEKYYDARAGLQNIITNTVYSKANAAAHEAYTGATSYTQTQVNTITSTTNSLSTLVNSLQGDVDGKAQMFSQATDPSSGFGSTNAEIDKHLGDIWYNTTSSTTQYFSNTTAGTYTSATKTGYYWVRTDLALEVFDYSDGKSALYTVANPTGYSENDLWIIPSSQTTDFPLNAGVGDTVVCTNAITANTATGKTSGGTVYAKTYRAADWSKLDKYTDDSYAKTKFADWATDGYLSPAERESLKREGEAITKDFNGITGHTYYDSCASSDRTNFYNAYTAATCAVTYHTTIQDNDKTKPVKIETGTSKTYGYGWISNFHEAKEIIRKHIDEKIKNAAQSGATATTKSYSDKMAEQLGYDDYEDMVNATKAKGKIITDGGYLAADLIEAGAITTDHLAAGAITADMISGTVANIVSAEIKDLTVGQLDTKPQQTNTLGKVNIQNNEINVYANAIDYNEVVKITGQNMPTIKSGETLTLNTNISELFEGYVQGIGGDSEQTSTKTLSKFTTPTGYCNYRIMIDTAPIIDIDFDYSGRLDEQTPVAGMDVDCLFKIRELGSSVDTTLSSCSYRRYIDYDDPTAPSNFSSYVTGGTNTEIVLKRNTTYELICSTTVENLCDPSIDGYVSLSRIGEYKLEESLNKLDVGVDGMRYVVSSNAMFECYKTSRDTLNVKIKSNKDYGLSVTDTGITLTLSGTTYKLKPQNGLLGLIKI